MHGTGVFHPQFKYHVRPTVNAAMLDRVEIYEPTGEAAEWVPGVGMADNGYRLVYRGRARIQPDQDWKARDRNFANELTSTMAMRVGIPVRGNELREDKMVPFIAKDYKVVVIEESEDTKGWLGGREIIVRNPIEASEKWLRTFVADTGTRIVNG